MKVSLVEVFGPHINLGIFLVVSGNSGNILSTQMGENKKQVDGTPPTFNKAPEK